MSIRGASNFEALDEEESSAAPASMSGRAMVPQILGAQRDSSAQTPSQLAASSGFSKKKRLLTLRPPDHFGEVSLVDKDHVHTVSATAASERLVLLVINAAVFLAVESSDEPSEQQWMASTKQKLEDAALQATAHSLREVPFLASLEMKQLVLLASLFQRVVRQPGDVICEQGRPGDGFYVVLSGKLRVYAKTEKGYNLKTEGIVELSTLAAGAFFGEFSLVQAMPCTASVAVQGARAARGGGGAAAASKGGGGGGGGATCRMLRLGKTAFESFLTMVPQIRKTITSLMTQRTAANMASAPIFAGVPPRQLDIVASLFGMRAVEKGEVILRKGELADGLILVSSGLVSVFTTESVSTAHGAQARDIHLATLGAGSFIGESSVALGLPASASVRGLQPTLLLVLPRAQFGALLSIVPTISAALQRGSKRRALDSLAKKSDVLFGVLSRKQLDALADRSSLRCYRPGDVVVQEGEEGTSLFVIIHGELTVHVDKAKLPGAARCAEYDDVVVATLSPSKGGYFGEGALVPANRGKKRLATVRAAVKQPTAGAAPAAESKVILIVITRDVWNEVLGDSPVTSSGLALQLLGYEAGLVRRFFFFCVVDRRRSPRSPAPRSPPRDAARCVCRWLTPAAPPSLPPSLPPQEPLLAHPIARAYFSRYASARGRHEVRFVRMVQDFKSIPLKSALLLGRCVALPLAALVRGAPAVPPRAPLTPRAPPPPPPHRACSEIHKEFFVSFSPYCLDYLPSSTAAPIKKALFQSSKSGIPTPPPRTLFDDAVKRAVLMLNEPTERIVRAHAVGLSSLPGERGAGRATGAAADEGGGRGGGGGAGGGGGRRSNQRLRTVQAVDPLRGGDGRALLRRLARRL
jgi:CRP-like cAMP-binding protein